MWLPGKYVSSTLIPAVTAGIFSIIPSGADSPGQNQDQFTVSQTSQTPQKQKTPRGSVAIHGAQPGGAPDAPASTAPFFYPWREEEEGPLQGFHSNLGTVSAAHCSAGHVKKLLTENR